MRLVEFIAANTEAILVQWDAFARSLLPGAKLTDLALRNDAAAVLLAITEDMRSSQDVVFRSAQLKAATADSAWNDPARIDANRDHAIGRLSAGFDLMQVISEYRALRASVLRLWRDSGPAAHATDVEDVTRFNESLDQAVAKAVSGYTRRVDESRDMFLAILSHDLRNPLNSIATSAELLPMIGHSAAESSEFAARISTSAAVMAHMISDLLDYTRTRLGAGLPISIAPMDLGVLAGQVVDEFRGADRTNTIHLRCEGSLAGEWDAARLRQVLSNLLGNAIQHGDENFPIHFTLGGDATHVHVAIANQGPPIPAGEIEKIFDPLVRGSPSSKPRHNRPGSIGLGLYIARELVIAHGGEINVTSSAADGTVFSFRIPRRHNAAAEDTRPGSSLLLA